MDHMLQLRALQDQTGGFQVFIPLAFHPQFSQMQDLPAPSGVTDLKVIAAARLPLDNIPHIKAYWVMLGIKMAQVAQKFRRQRPGRNGRRRRRFITWPGPKRPKG